MEPLIEPLRYVTSLFAIATAVVMANTLKGVRTPLTRAATVWLVIATIAGAFLSHVMRSLPIVALLPAGTAVGLALGVASLFSPAVEARFASLEDGPWRLLMGLRAVFGALLLGAGALGLFPASFALAAGLGDLATGFLAIVVPGSLATGGHRGYRLLVFGVGFADFIGVVSMIITIVVPWLAQTHSVGITLLLPWVAVPLLAAVNLFGLRGVFRELGRVPVTSA